MPVRLPFVLLDCVWRPTDELPPQGASTRTAARLTIPASLVGWWRHTLGDLDEAFAKVRVLIESLI